ncbi:trichohyalin, partial [Salmo trutta]|uniref:trichohyalin n=1 Tax=Salmo trutta TaxID=8032 RepID=UPI0011305C85
MYPMYPERHSHQREYGEPEICSQRREYEEPERCSQREYEEPERCSQRREYEEPERCSQRREYEEPERCSQWMVYEEPETCSQWRVYEEPETCSQRREYGEPSSGQWDDDLETRDNGQAMAREPYSEYSSMRRTREGWEEYGTSSDMSYIMDPSSGDWSEDSLRGSGAPFSPDTDGDVDGDPVELSVEDRELLRKRMELEIIEKQIARKKAALAMELVGPESKAIRKQKTKDKDLEMLTKNVSNKDVTLKERVNNILRKRAWTNECRSKEAANQQVPPKLVLYPPKVVKSFVERMNESILHKDSIMKGNLTLDVHEEEHPLKLKVEALLEQRRNPTVNKEDKAAKGFQYFLNVLNKGVDIDRLSKIVNNFKDLPSMGEELPQGQPPPLDGQLETTSKSQRKVPSRKRRSRFDELPPGWFNILSGQPTLLGVQPNPLGDLLREVVPAGCVLQQDRSLLQSGGEEIGQHSLSLGFIQAMDGPKNKKSKSPPVEEKRKGRHKSKSPPVEEKREGRHKSKSPPVEEKRKERHKSKSPPVEEKREGRHKSKSPPVEEKRKERHKSMSPQLEEKRKMRPEDEQKYGLIQSLLQPIGMDLGEEELGRLNDRIQERLYGKKRDLEKKGGKKESVWEVEKEESKKDKEESKKDKEEGKKDKEESKKDKEESKKDKEESKKDKEESKKDKEESKKDKEESKKDKEESEKDKEEEENEKDKEEEESEKDKEEEESEKDKEEEESEKDKEEEESEKDKQKEKEESEKGKDKEERACSSKCHSISLLSDSSNSSPPCHRWTTEYKRSSTRDQDRERDRGRSERDRDRRSSTRDQDRERDRGRSK